MRERQNITVNCNGQDIFALESFVDSICDEYNVYNNFFGNIIMALVSAHDECRERDGEESKIDIEFYNNSRGLNFIIHPCNRSMINDSEEVLLNTDLLYEDEKYNWLFLINRLSDEFQIVDGKLNILFDIASINQELATTRANSLRAYFKGETIKSNIQYH